MKPGPSVPNTTVTVLTMDGHPGKRKRETSPPTTTTGRDSATPASQFFQTEDGDQLQARDATGSGAKAWEKFVASVVATYQFGDGKLPPVSTFLNKLPLYRGVSAEARSSSDNGVRPETVTSGSSPAAAGSQLGAAMLPPSGEQAVPLQVTESLDTPQPTAASETLNPDPVHLIPTSPRLGGDTPVTSFTIPPTEEGTVSPVCDSCGVCMEAEKEENKD